MAVTDSKTPLHSLRWVDAIYVNLEIQLTRRGVRTLGQLAKLDFDATVRIARELERRPETVNAWVQEAKAILAGRLAQRKARAAKAAAKA